MKRVCSIAVLAVCTGLSLYAFGTKETLAAKEALELRIGALKGPSGMGMIELFENSPALPDQLSVRFEALSGADSAAAKLLSGELDGAVLPVNMAAKLYNAGLPYRMAALVGNGMVKILSADASIRSLADLQGRELHVAGQGATPEFLLRAVLKHAGMDADKDLRLSFNLPYPEMAASLASGKIAVAVLPEPFATVAMKANPALRESFSLGALWTAATGQPDYPMTVFVLRSSLIAERPAGAKALLLAYKASIEGVMADPEAAGLLVEKHDFGLKAPIAAAAVPKANFTFEGAPEARNSVEALLSLFLEAAPASIGGKLPDEAFYANIGL
jgi:NitT/TauT family transport system substrate-binding protein